MSEYVINLTDKEISDALLLKEIEKGNEKGHYGNMIILIKRDQHKDIRKIDVYIESESSVYGIPILYEE